METSTDILNELTSISPLIAGMKKVNVFTVPVGYFDTISETVLACLQEENGTAYPASSFPQQTAPVPEGYFDHLASSILNKIKSAQTASNEIRDLSPLLHAIQNKNVFEVPEGYFDSIGKIINEKITTGTAKEEISVISPLLSAIQSKAVFEVPSGYFESLAGDILKKTSPTLGKIISLRARNLIIKYAVAAMMTGALALGLYNYIDNPPADGITNANSVATLDAAIEKGKKMNEQQFNEVLENLTEADIAKYLEKNGDITDVAVLGNNMEDGNLPSMEDYLLDESTLENYLKKIDTISFNN